MKYFDEKYIRDLEETLRSLYKYISKDPKFINKTFMSNERWEFFEEYFERYANEKIRNISEGLTEKYPDIKRALSMEELYRFLREAIYLLTFSKIMIIIEQGQNKNGSMQTGECEIRELNLESALKGTDKRELRSIINYADEHIVKKVGMYKKCKAISLVNVSNIEIEPKLNWKFGNVYFVSEKESVYKDQHLRWITEGMLAEEEDDEKGCALAVLRFEGRSSFKALEISLSYFNKVFSILRLLAELKLLRQHWTSRKYLKTPDKSIAVQSSIDLPLYSSIRPSIDNDFFVALQENSIYLPVILNSENIRLISGYEYMDSLESLLERSFKENTYSIDESIFDALSWYSESLKHCIIPHTIIGFVTALETLLTNRKSTEGSSDKGIAEMFAERGAIILHDTYEQRLEAKKQLKKIYSLRSRIVHGSNRQVFRSNNEEINKLNEVQRMTSKIIARVIHLVHNENLQSIEKLNDYVQKQLLS